MPNSPKKKSKFRSGHEQAYIRQEKKAEVAQAVTPKTKFQFPKLSFPTSSFRLGSYLIGLFLISSLVLMGLPRVLHFTDKKVEVASQIAANGDGVSGVSAASKRLVTKITEQNITPPIFKSNVILALDVDSGQILYQKNANLRVSPASTTKIMTALVALEHFHSDDVLFVSQTALVGGSSMGLSLGEQLSFRGLLYGMLLNSGNDAAYAIASNYPGGLAAFVAQMNQKAKDLGLNNTHFENPAGFDGATHYSSATDLAKIALAAEADSQFARVVSTKETIVSDLSNIATISAQKRTHRLTNLNKLLTEDGVIGIKTGFTEIAGENLVGLVDRESHKVLTVVLGSEDRFGETKQLMDWTYLNYDWQEEYE